MSKGFYTLTVLLLFFSTMTNGQTARMNTEPTNIAGMVQAFNRSFPQEKVFLQFDNTSYFQGETIWFKAFVVNATTFMRSKSTVLYVDLLSPTGVLLEQQKLKIVAGQADGCFSLLEQSTTQARELRGIQPYPSGYYEIRAYTQYMLNFDENIVFSRVLPVFKQPDVPGYYDNPVVLGFKKEKKTLRPENEKNKEVNVLFFPEGGKILFDRPARIAYKATDENGVPLDGVLLIKTPNRYNGDIEAPTIHEGMGRFTLPTDTREMKGVFIYNGKEYKVALPYPEHEGCSLIVDNNDSVLSVTVNKLEFYENRINFMITCSGQPVYFSSMYSIPDSNFTHVDIPIGKLPIGVCQLTIADDKKILGTRFFFNHREDFRPPQLTIKTDKESYAPHEIISLTLSLMNGQGHPLRDRFCLSVRDAQNIETAYQDNLATSLLLSSDLKGLINNPQYYFESNDKVHRLAMDLLMMVQGWERYDMGVMSGQKFFEEQHRMEDSLSVNGWVTSVLSKKVKLNEVKTYITVAPVDNTLQVQYAQQTTGSDGYFGFNVMDYYDKADLVMLLERTNNFAKNTGANIILERAIQPAPRKYEKRELEFRKRNETKKTNQDNHSFMNPLYSANDAVNLPEVEIVAPRKYIDYFTFNAYDVEKDVERVLDFGEWTTDVLGYLLDKGYTFTKMEKTQTTRRDSINNVFLTDLQDFGMEEYAFNSLDYLDENPVFWYIHNSERIYLMNKDEPLAINTEDIESILVFDDPASLYEISETVPLYMDYLTSHLAQSTLNMMRGNTTSKRFILIDIKMKEDYKINSENQKRNRGQRITTLRGFDYPVQFYSPKYHEGPIEGQKDYRRTLYWNPNVITDEEGNARVEFYNNSYSTNFTVTGAGITASGTPYVLDTDF